MFLKVILVTSLLQSKRSNLESFFQVCFVNVDFSNLGPPRLSFFSKSGIFHLWIVRGRILVKKTEVFRQVDNVDSVSLPAELVGASRSLFLLFDQSFSHSSY